MALQKFLLRCFLVGAILGLAFFGLGFLIPNAPQWFVDFYEAVCPPFSIVAVIDLLTPRPMVWLEWAWVLFLVPLWFGSWFALGGAIIRFIWTKQKSPR